MLHLAALSPTVCRLEETPGAEPIGYLDEGRGPLAAVDVVDR